MSTPRPELGELVTGQRVMVRRSPNDMRHRPAEQRYIPAEVVKASRVWIELEGIERVNQWSSRLKWRMRRDTQDEGTQYTGSNASFVTMDQCVWDETLNRARAVLAENGIRLDRDSRWIGREVELAELISGVDS